MGALYYTLLESESELSDFDCGNSSINRLVSESFFPHILKQCRTYKISMEKQRVGFCSVSILGISLDESDASMADYYSNTPSYGAVKLDYIAVDSRVQKYGIGTTALEYVKKQAKQMYDTCPVRLLVLDALRDRIKWYTKNGFEAINSADLQGDSETVRMYIDLMPDEDKQFIDDYIEAYYE